MEIYPVKKGELLLLKWEEKGEYKESERFFILVTSKEIQAIEKKEFTKFCYEGYYHTNEIEASKELTMRKVSSFFSKRFSIILEVKTYCYAEFNYSSSYLGVICIENPNEFNIFVSSTSVVYEKKLELI